MTITSITGPAGVAVNNKCTATLGINQQCWFNLTVTPTTAGAITGNVVITTSAGTYNVPVSGNAI